jgi:hypothetical protein
MHGKQYITLTKPLGLTSGVTFDHLGAGRYQETYPLYECPRHILQYLA